MCAPGIPFSLISCFREVFSPCDIFLERIDRIDPVSYPFSFIFKRMWGHPYCSLSSCVKLSGLPQSSLSNLTARTRSFESTLSEAQPPTSRSNVDSSPATVWKGCARVVALPRRDRAGFGVVLPDPSLLESPPAVWRVSACVMNRLCICIAKAVTSWAEKTAACRSASPSCSPGSRSSRFPT